MPKRKFKSALKKSKRARVASGWRKVNSTPRLRYRSMVPFRNVNLGAAMPDKVTMKHKYAELIQLNTGASGALNRYTFSTNGMYDPNITGTGHQPLYFDQMSVLFNHYCVIGAKIVVKLIPINQSQPACQFGLTVNDDLTTTATNMEDIDEQTRAKLRLATSATTNAYTMSMKWSASKVFGKNLLANNALQGSYSANPSEQQYFDLCYLSPNASATQWFADVHIEYIAIWSERKDVARS